MLPLIHLFSSGRAQCASKHAWSWPWTPQYISLYYDELCAWNTMQVLYWVVKPPMSHPLPGANMENSNTWLPRKILKFCNNFSWNMDLNIMEYGCSWTQALRKRWLIFHFVHPFAPSKKMCSRMCYYPQKLIFFSFVTMNSEAFAWQVPSWWIFGSYLASDLTSLPISHMEMFIKPEVLQENSISYRIANLDYVNVSNANIQLPAKKIGVGNKAKLALASASPKLNENGLERQLKSTEFFKIQWRISVIVRTQNSHGHAAGLISKWWPNMRKFN